jgi:hypothetical protein
MRYVPLSARQYGVSSELHALLMVTAITQTLVRFTGEPFFGALLFSHSIMHNQGEDNGRC